MDNLSLALLITGLGMGLVFAVILLLWVLIALIVRLGGFMEHSRLAESGDSSAIAMQVERQLAAALAVAVALAAAQQPAQDDEVHIFPLPPTAVVSPWQAVMRSKILNKRGPLR